MKPLKINYNLPEIITADIDQLVDYVNSTPKCKQYSLDLHQSNLIADLNAYDNLPSEIVRQIKDYYCRGDICE